MPSTTSTCVSVPLASSTVMTPSLFTLPIASAISLPIVVVVVGRNRGDLLDLVDVARRLPGSACAAFSTTVGYGLVDTALQVHRVGTCGHVLHAYADDSLCQHRSGRRTVTGVVVGLRSHLLDHLGAHVGERGLPARSPWLRSHRPWSPAAHRTSCR